MSGIIIVGVDGSETALKAARTAADLAAGTGATLTVVTAYGNDKSEIVEIAGEEWTISNAAEAKKVAQRVAGQLSAKGVRATYTAALGKPHEVLLNEAERLGAAMIVVGNRRMQGLARVLGSVANNVAHNSPCDVYIVKTD
ncbi:universal stress protein [Arthrobacter sp. STN4]|uniref:universal stress protein n=1 Tax=Arthrobacter sp. STN4 TaxID=2923276 RepID=UPI00211A5079|nr:universal stress protein [Arthrobacter sp. STN4]MCQ9164544.1 universal stress protein [Arthrobacter sp. STN4]